MLKINLDNYLSINDKGIVSFYNIITSKRLSSILYNYLGYQALSTKLSLNSNLITQAKLDTLNIPLKYYKSFNKNFSLTTYKLLIDLLDQPNSSILLDIKEAKQKRIQKALLIITILIKEKKTNAKVKAYYKQNTTYPYRAAKKVSKAYY